MLKHLKQSFLLTIFLLLVLGFAYPGVMWGIAKIIPHQSQGSPIYKDGSIVGYKNIGQSFTDDKYFWGRPSAVAYNAAGSAGSNKGPSNPGYLLEVQGRIDSFLVHNPGISKNEIPSELVTASGGGLDPHITVQGALIQVSRIAKERNLSADLLKKLIADNTEKPLLGLFGTERINVLQLNLSLDAIK